MSYIVVQSLKFTFFHVKILSTLRQTMVYAVSAHNNLHSLQLKP